MIFFFVSDWSPVQSLDKWSPANLVHFLKGCKVLGGSASAVYKMMDSKDLQGAEFLKAADAQTDVCAKFYRTYAKSGF